MQPKEIESPVGQGPARQGALLSLLKRQRAAFLDRHSRAQDFPVRMFSAATYCGWIAMRAALDQYCRGDVLDAGCGHGAWRTSIEAAGATYHSIDVAPRGSHHPTWIGDVSSMSDISDERFDTIFCNHVLEHVRHPEKAFREFKRTLRPGGSVIVSVPHLSRRHELPYDFFRYTQEGLVALAEDAGLSVVEIHPYGGILSFLHHQISTIVPGLFAGVPLAGAALIALNAPISWLTARLDPMLDRACLMPLGVLVVAQKGR